MMMMMMMLLNVGDNSVQKQQLLSSHCYCECTLEEHLLVWHL